LTDTTDMIPVPRELVEYAASQLRGVHDDAGDQLHALLPPPPSPRLRVVNLDKSESMIIGADRLYVDASDAQDPMIAIEQEVREVFGPMYDLGSTGRDVLLARIRAALEGATS
jgi:hypothetical protein